MEKADKVTFFDRLEEQIDSEINGYLSQIKSEKDTFISKSNEFVQFMINLSEKIGYKQLNSDFFDDLFEYDKNGISKAYSNLNDILEKISDFNENSQKELISYKEDLYMRYFLEYLSSCETLNESLKTLIDAKNNILDEINSYKYNRDFLDKSLDYCRKELQNLKN
jgi:hypothetical protein